MGEFSWEYSLRGVIRATTKSTRFTRRISAFGILSDFGLRISDFAMAAAFPLTVRSPILKLPKNHLITMPSNDAPTNITSVSTEKRVFPPRKEFSKTAHIKSLAQYRKLYGESVRSPEKFWAKQAKNELVWFRPWKKVLDWKEPFAKWFIGGQTNVSYNCLDRHLGTPTANKAALIWEGEPAGPGKSGEERTFTYKH